MTIAIPITPAAEPKGKTVADVLRHAARIIEERGSCNADWMDKQGRVCMLGAITLAQGRDPVAEQGKYAAGSVYWSPSVEHLRIHLGETFVGIWNDWHTQKERIAALRAAADAWEQGQ